jgi:serine/threonine protein kinase
LKLRQLDFFEEPDRYYIVLECLSGGELFNRIIAKTYFNEKEARDCVKHVLKALKYCHDQNIVHR